MRTMLTITMVMLVVAVAVANDDHYDHYRSIDGLDHYPMDV
jgi:hypothetical protein